MIAQSIMSDGDYIASLNRELMISNAERDRYRAALTRLAALRKVQSSPTAARILSDVLDKEEL